MREIKFRAWDGKQMFFVTFDVLMSKESYFRNCLQNKKYKLMQFTGLKDQNGKEIYEGDIVKHKDGSTECVKYQEVMGSDDMGTDMLGYPIWYSYSKIIGNIYENPKLLKKSEI